MFRHQITRDKSDKPYEYTCSRCGWSWTREPSSDCPGVRRYSWKSAPAYLKTFTQLRAMGLKPRDRSRPDGVVLVSMSHWTFADLYDEREAIPRRRYTEKQRQAFEVAWPRTQEKYTCKHCGDTPNCLGDLQRFASPGMCKECRELRDLADQEYAKLLEIEYDQTQAHKWAAKIWGRTDWCVLDTETTSLDGYVVELAIVDRSGATLFNSLINPEHPVSPGAFAVHGISDAALATAPTLPHVWDEVCTVLSRFGMVLTYNADFDQSILEQSASRYGLALPSELKWRCLMKKYARYCGNWSEYYQSYKWLPLYGGHRALDDALAALSVFRAMAHNAPTSELEEREAAAREP